jgi:hypothetical protein
MSKIATYSLADTPLQLSDRLIGTEAPRPTPSATPLATKNFSLGELLQLFSGNFPAATLQAVLNAGNTATQNITLVGTIDTTLIRPDNIEDTSGSQGLPFQFLSKGASSINWGYLPVDNLQAVLNAGNTATQSITLVGNITSTRIIPGNIQDDTTGIGTIGQFLSKTASGIRWVNSPTSTTPGLGDVLSVGNTAINDINLTGNVTASSFIKTGGTNLQYLMADGSVTTLGGASLVALPFTTDHLSATNNQYIIGDVVWYLGNVYRCIASNDSIIPTNALYWVNLGAGYPLVQQPTDWNATSGNNQILNKPTIPTLTSQLTNDSGFLTQDNVVEYPDLASFPVTGVIGTIYIALDTEDFYLWDGSGYVLTTPPDTGITGVGTTNTYAKFTSPTTIGNGRLVDGVNGGIYTFGSQWINLINGGSVLTLNRSQSSINFQLGVPNALPTTISSTQNQEGLHITSIGDFVLKAGNPLGVVYNVNRANRNIHIGASTDTDYATQKLQVTGNLRVTGAVYDSNNSAGTAGQLLSSTATGTYWIDPPSYTTFVPYTGATADVNLGTHKLLAKDLVINHPSGSGDAATITKGGSGEALKVVKSSGSGNAASVTGGVTLLQELHLTTDLADAYISSAATWNAKQNALGYTPYRFVNATQATYLGAVIGLAETAVAQTTILGGTFNATDFMRTFFKITKPVTAFSVTTRIRVNTTNTLVGATQIAIWNIPTTSTYSLMPRHINLFGGNGYSYNSNSSLLSDIVAVATAGTTFTYNTANDLYVFFTIQFNNVADSATFQLANITN